MSKMSRRTACQLLAGALPAVRLAAMQHEGSPGIEIERGPFEGTRASLSAYRVPEWFRDAKFGIWAHWGPQSAIEDGDWYARNMYMQGSKQNLYHCETYGHPSKFGYKDTIPLWKAEQFDPAHLIDLYRKAGAKYFMSMGVHHDNFDMWNSAYQSWNAVNKGPKRDIVGEWSRAAREAGLKFAVSEHLWITYKWFSTSHGYDGTGPYAGVPYDGANPNNFSLYADSDQVWGKSLDWNETGIPLWWRRHWYLRIKDLVDKYQPDLLYTDGPLPFEEYGLSLVAHLYNRSAKTTGKAEAVYTCKRVEDSEHGVATLDVERGIVNSIWPRPWQTDTCIGQWHYKRGQEYKTPKTIIDMLCDIVSRNGNLMLNFPLPSRGMLDLEELAVLAEITRWMSVNSRAIHGTRPWKIFGEGPGTDVAASSAAFNEQSRKDLTAEDVRFTTQGDALYAFVMGWPEYQAIIKPLATHTALRVGKIENVELLGFDGKLVWSQDDTGLKVMMPAQKPCDYAVAFKVTGATT